MSKKDVTDDIMDTPLTLKRSGYRIAIGSSSKKSKRILERDGLLDTYLK